MMPSTHLSSDRSDPDPSPQDLPLFQGGVFFQILRWARLAGNDSKKVGQRVAALVLLTWLPLLVLSAIDGRLMDESFSVPFLVDVEAHIRFLVVLPLLLLAEVQVQRLMPPILRQFREGQLIAQEAIPAWEAARASAHRLHASVAAEIVMLALVYGVGILTWQHYATLDVNTWYATPLADSKSFKLAGIWYSFVSLPIVQFLFLRWYYRLLIWARLLWQVSRLDLKLLPAHPDRCGGLGFLVLAGSAFAMLAAAHGAIAAGPIASRIFFAGAELTQFADVIGAVVIFMLCVVFGPILFFGSRLFATRQAGLLKYGILAIRYNRDFDAKWLDGAPPPADETLLGSADIQSLADLANSYGVVRSMRLTPITPIAVLQLVAATLTPILPLLLTMYSPEQLIEQLGNILLII
jgi:hypothetical protein